MQRLNRPEEHLFRGRVTRYTGSTLDLDSQLATEKVKKFKRQKDREGEEKNNPTLPQRAKEGIRALVPRINKAG